MSEFEVLAGDHGRGSGSYLAGTFYMPRRSRIGIEEVAGLATQGTIEGRNVLGTVASGFKGAAGLAPVGALIGIFGAPAIVPAALTGAAIGAALGLLGGGKRSRALLHVTLADSTSFSVLCEIDLPDTLTREAKAVQGVEARRAKALKVINPPAGTRLEGDSKQDQPSIGLIESATTTVSEAARIAADGISGAATATQEAVEASWTTLQSWIRRPKS